MTRRSPTPAPSVCNLGRRHSAHAACCPNAAGFLLDDMKDFNARVFRLLAKEMKVEDLSVPKEEPGEHSGVAWNRKACGEEMTFSQSVQGGQGGRQLA